MQIEALRLVLYIFFHARSVFAMTDSSSMLDSLFDPGLVDADARDSEQEEEVTEEETKKRACSLSSVMLPLYSHPGTLQYLDRS